MILQRLAEAIQEQNWFTVIIEVLIVVFGVVIGIEISNLNEDRKFDAQEREFLGQLREEIISNNRRLDGRIAMTEGVIEAGRKGMDFLKQDQPCNENCAGLLIDFFHASQVWGISGQQRVYSEMQRLGLPRSPEIKDSVDDYYSVFSGVAVTQEALPDYRKQVRHRIPMNLMEMLWRHCHRVIDGDIEELVENCEAVIGEIDASVLEYIRMTPGIYDNLNGWIGQNMSTLQQLPRQKAQGLVAIETIETGLGHSN